MAVVLYVEGGVEDDLSECVCHDGAAPAGLRIFVLVPVGLRPRLVKVSPLRGSVAIVCCRRPLCVHAHGYLWCRPCGAPRRLSFCSRPSWVHAHGWLGGATPFVPAGFQQEFGFVFAAGLQGEAAAEVLYVSANGVAVSEIAVHDGVVEAQRQVLVQTAAQGRPHRSGPRCGSHLSSSARRICVASGPRAYLFLYV